jgi:hypothetical protein
MRIATRQDWETLPMPDESEKIAFEREYSISEFERLRAGLVPGEMEDKWFIFFEDPYLYLHRSWTGFCIYRVRFDQSETRARVVEVVVNRRLDQYQYRGAGDEGEFLGILLDGLLGRDTRAAMLNYVRSLKDGAGPGNTPDDHPSSLRSGGRLSLISRIVRRLRAGRS